MLYPLLITDLPVILISIFLFSQIQQLNTVLGLISFAGALFAVFLGYSSIKTRYIANEIKNTRPASLKIGIITNFLNPHPYLFWITIGAPSFLRAFEIHILVSASFILTFYALLVGSKIIIAYFTARSKK
ncbi:MAG: LysE family transporter [Bacteroidales bacterium]|nr:LysE family transporter [Bacteroidales bacterium]